SNICFPDSTTAGWGENAAFSFCADRYPEPGHRKISLYPDEAECLESFQVRLNQDRSRQCELKSRRGRYGANLPATYYQGNNLSEKGGLKSLLSGLSMKQLSPQLRKNIRYTEQNYPTFRPKIGA